MSKPEPYYSDAALTFYCGDVLDVLRQLPDESVHCVVTSPPYWALRDYGHESQIGLESTPQEYVANMVAVFDEVRRVLRSDGTCWLNLGDSFYSSTATQGRNEDKSVGNIAGLPQITSMGAKTFKRSDPLLKPKDLVGIPWRVAFALQERGWWLRSEITWCKRAPMPESVTDRPTSATEKVFLLTKSARYFYDADAVRVPHSRNWFNESVGPEYMTARDGRNDGGKRKGNGNPSGRNLWNYWLLSPSPFPEAHFATFPPELPRTCINAGSPEGGTVLDPFLGSGTTALVAQQLGRRCIGIDINDKYLDMAVRRCAQKSLWFGVANA